MPKLASKPLQLPATPTRPHPFPPPEPSWLTGPALKAATEHLFATQRAKKASDRAKGKRPRPTWCVASSPVAARGTNFAMEKVWAESMGGRAAADDGDWPELPTPPMLSSSSPALRATQDRCEVPLAALVRPVKLRGAKRKVRFVVLRFNTDKVAILKLTFLFF
jgi:hypothetical protein